MPDRLANYVPVAERVTQAQDALVAVDADPPVMLTDMMGYIRVAVYLGDGRKATGTASFRLDLDGRSAQATNPIEDCETSAVGRALAFLGFSSSRSIASREEVRTAEQRGASYNKPKPQAAPNGAKKAPSRDSLMTRIVELTEEATNLGLEILRGDGNPMDADTIAAMTDAELIQHGKNLRAAIEQAKAAVKA